MSDVTITSQLPLIANWLRLNIGLPSVAVVCASVASGWFGSRRTVLEVTKDGQIFILCVGISASALRDFSLRSAGPFAIATIALIPLLAVPLYVVAVVVNASNWGGQAAAQMIGWMSMLTLVFSAVIVLWSRAKSGAL